MSERSEKPRGFWDAWLPARPLRLPPRPLMSAGERRRLERVEALLAGKAEPRKEEVKP